MSITRENSRRQLLALQLPPAVLDIFDGKPPHPALEYRCREPFYVFATDIDALDENLIPLWECGISVTAYRHHKRGGTFVKFSLEAPDEFTVLGATFPALVASVLAVLWEDAASEVELREVAALMEFKEIERLIRELKSQPTESNGADFHLWKSRFVKSFEVGGT